MKNLFISIFILTFMFGIVIKIWLRPKKYSYIIPAYIPLGERFDLDFDGIANFSKKNNVITIVNPNNGPISREENEYYFKKLKKKIKQVQNNGGKVIGYVSTEYGNRDQKDVRNDIDLWENEWDIDGIFLDEGLGSCNNDCQRMIKKYQDYYEYIGNKIIVTNAGYIDENYEKFLKDRVIMIIFENTYKNFISPNNYLNKMELNKGKKGVLLHTTPKDIDEEKIKKLYKKYDLDYIYLTFENWDTISLKLLEDL